MRKPMLLGLLVPAVLAATVIAQVPAPPASPTPPAAAAAPAAPAPADAAGAAGQAKGLLPGLCACIEKCKQKFCASPLGALANNALLPLNTFAGGMLPSCCPTLPTAADLAKPGAEGTAAKIKAEEADAKARRASVRYLGTVDCHYFPDAEKGLIVALRTDTNECVRWEAALALGNGCCCTKKTMAALVLAATGSEKDNNPGETSERVRAAAFAALEHCVACYVRVEPVPAVPPVPPERPPGGRPEVPPGTTFRDAPLEDQLRVAAYYDRVEAEVNREQLVAESRRLVGEWKAATAEAADKPRAVPTGHRNLYELWQIADRNGAPPESETAIEQVIQTGHNVETPEPPTAPGGSQR